MNNKSLTLALVIPVYNEERYLKACLDSIARQSVKPNEVIVVDNNSTDDSVKIAKCYKFVTILHEPCQHQVYAQVKGFNYSSSDIIGRIDADTILPDYWVKNIKQAFSVKPELDGLRGGAEPYDTYFSTTARFIFNTYYRLADLLAGHCLLWGANCAISRPAWETAKKEIRLAGDIWEDYDLAFVLAQNGHRRIFRAQNINAGVSFRAIHKNLIWQFKYNLRAPRTFLIRKGLLRAVIFFLLLTLPSLFLIYPLTALDSIMTKLKNIPDVPTERG